MLCCKFNVNLPNVNPPCINIKHPIANYLTTVLDNLVANDRYL